MAEWLRLHTEFAQDPIVQRLCFEDQRHYIMLLCAKKSGLVDKPHTDKSLNESLRNLLSLTPAQLKNAKRRLVRSGLIDEKWQPTGWDKRQYIGKTQENTDGITHNVKAKMQDNLAKSIDESAFEPINIDDGTQAGRKRDDDGTMAGRKTGDNPLKLNGKEKDVGRWRDAGGTQAGRRWDAGINGVTQSIEKTGENLACDLLFTDSDSETDKTLHGDVSTKRVTGADVAHVLRYLNDASGSGFRWKNPKGKPTAHAKAIQALLRDGYTIEQCCAVIDHKAAQWGHDDTMREFLRPSTLFRRSKFEQYLDQAE